MMRYLYICLFAAALVGCSDPAPSQRQSPPAVVTTASVAASQWQDSIEALGSARAKESITIASKLTETVDRVRFESGQSVDGGQILVDLDEGANVAELDEARTALAEAERQLTRQRQLAAQKLIPASQLDAAVAARDSARARTQASSARLSDRVIAAPFSGVLGLRQVSPGQLLTPGTLITTLDDISQVLIDFAVPEMFLSTLSNGMSITARSDAWPEQLFEGVVQSVDSRVDVATRSVTVRAVIENPDKRLRPGMLLRMNLLQPAREALMVPEIAVMQSGATSYVFRIKPDDTVEQATVKTGVRGDGQVEIIEGLTAGDRIVIEGTVKLRAGQRIVDAAKTDNAAAVAERR